MGSQRRIAGGAMVLALTQLGASIAGLVRDRVLASTFTPGLDPLDTVSVYIAAFRPSDLLFQMFIMSAFSVALVPLLAGHLAHGRKEAMDRLLSNVLFIALLFFGVVALLLAVSFSAVAPLLIDFEGERLQLYIQFGRIALITNFLFVAGNAFGQYLIARQTYWIYGITPILYTIGTIVGTVLLTPTFGPFGPMIGTLGGAVVYVVVRFLGCRRLGCTLAFVAEWRKHPFTSEWVFPFSRVRKALQDAELREMGWLMLPRMAALGAMQVQLLFFDKLASGLELGSVTINAYARNFQAAAVGIIGIALAQSVYSLLSQAAAKKKMQRFWAYLKKGTMLSVGLSILATVALILLARVAAWLVHLTEPRVLSTFLIALGIYALSIPFESVNHLLLRAWYSLKNTKVPAVTSVLNGVIAITVAWMFAPAYGVYALAVGFLVGQVVQVVGLWGFLRKRVRKDQLQD